METDRGVFAAIPGILNALGAEKVKSSGLTLRANLTAAALDLARHRRAGEKNRRREIKTPPPTQLP